MKVAQVGNNTVIAVRGPGGSLRFYWQPIGHQQWNRGLQPNSGAGEPPSVAQVGNNMVIAATDEQGNLWFYWQPIGSQQWNSELVSESPVDEDFGPPSVAQVGHSSVIAISSAGEGAGPLWFY